MGRYVAEERDTGRRLRDCYAIVSAGAPSTNGHADTAALEARLERIECAIAELAAATKPAAEGAVRQEVAGVRSGVQLRRDRRRSRQARSAACSSDPNA